MATANVTPLMSVEDYLNSHFRPDMDYLDGILEQRNLGEFDHGDLQLAISAILRAN